MVRVRRLVFAAPALVAIALASGCGEEERPGRAGKVIVHDDVAPNRIRLELGDDDLTGDGKVQSVVVQLTSQTDPKGIEVRLERKTEDGYVSFQASGIRLTDPANGWWPASNAEARVLVAKSGETITATYRDADPPGAVTGTRTFTAKPELHVKKTSPAADLPRAPEGEKVVGHDFGSVTVGGAKSVEIRVENVGEAPMLLVGVPLLEESTTPSFESKAEGFPATVAPKSAFGHPIVFRPQVVGTHEAIATVHVDGDAWKFWIVGTGE